MGVWNSTCHISGLTIMPGERIIAFPIIGCSFFMVPIKGTINDIGGFDTIDPDPIHEIFIDRVNHIIVNSDTALASAESRMIEEEQMKVHERELMAALNDAKEINDTDEFDRIRAELDAFEPYFSMMSGDQVLTINDLMAKIAKQEIRWYDRHINTFMLIDFMFVKENVWNEMVKLASISHSDKNDSDLKKFIDPEFTEQGKTALIEMSYRSFISSYMTYNYIDVMSDYIVCNRAYVDRLDHELVDLLSGHLKDMNAMNQILSKMRKPVQCDMYRGTQGNYNEFMRNAYSIFVNCV